jgi:alkanesulfonate monooxygenase SsuD/methylene tetrahydromethanopterin reductase-like flavin-dependent oxidoreductase (luciferase family)
LVILDIQFSAGANDWPQLRAATLRAEAEGYDTIWVFDHFDGAMIGGDRPMLECFTLLGAMAAVTDSVGLGTLVANVANRHPAMLTLAASSVQRISGGRLRLGLGAGASPTSAFGREHAERGIQLKSDMAARQSAVVEQIALLREVEPMPIIVGVNSVALIRLAVEHADGINVRLGHDRVVEFVDTARELAADRPFEISAWGHLAHRPDEIARAEHLGIDRLVLVNLGSIEKRAPRGRDAPD